MAETLKIKDLVDIVEEKTGEPITPAEARVHLRKLAEDGDIERGEGRWEFKGKTDPAIKAVIARVKSGAKTTATKKAKADDDEEAVEEKPKATRTRKPAAKKTTPRKPAAKKSASKPKDDTIEDIDDFEVDIEDI